MASPQSIFLKIQYPQSIGLLSDDALDTFLRSLQKVSSYRVYSEINILWPSLSCGFASFPFWLASVVKGWDKAYCFSILVRPLDVLGWKRVVLAT